jgi:hypothetical protein
MMMIHNHGTTEWIFRLKKRPSIVIYELGDILGELYNTAAAVVAAVVDWTIGRG